LENFPDSDFVKSIIALFPNSYVEITPSGNGVHIILLVDVSQIPAEYDKGLKRYTLSNGDISDYTSPSQADLAFMNILAWCTRRGVSKQNRRGIG
jgi:primase-polymerase (primpol)-like protein